MLTYTEVQVCNMALSRIGWNVPIPTGDGTVVNMSTTNANTSKAVEACQQWYPTVRDIIGSDFPFGRQKLIAELVLADDGTGELWDDVWENAWEYPANCLFLQRFIQPSSGVWPLVSTDWPNTTWDGVPGAQWAIGVHDGEVVIFANGIDDNFPLVEYTMQQGTALIGADMNFVDALAWRLACELAVPLHGVDGGNRLRDWCERNFAISMDRARRISANEQARIYETDGRWVRSRDC